MVAGFDVVGEILPVVGVFVAAVLVSFVWRLIQRQLAHMWPFSTRVQHPPKISLELSWPSRLRPPWLRDHPFSLPALIFPLAVVVGTVALILVNAPDSAELRDGTVDQFFSTGAQVLAAVLIGLAIEARSTAVGVRSAPATEVIQALAYITLGEAMALIGLLPDLWPVIYLIGMVVVPAALFAGLGAIFALVYSGPDS